MQAVRKGSEIKLNFDNITDFDRYLSKNSHLPSTNGTVTRGDYNFFQTHDWDEFEGYMKQGNPDVTKDLKRHTQMYIDKFVEQMAESSAYQFDVVGEFFDIGAVMVGEPEAWIKEVKIEDDKFITLDIQGVYQDGTDLYMVRENGAKVFAIATVLEQQGFLVRINMHYSTRNSGGYGTTLGATIKVKDYDSTLDYKKFGILLGVPFFRRGILRLLEIEYGVDLAGGYGSPLYGAVDGEIRLDNSSDVEGLERKLANEEK